MPGSSKANAQPSEVATPLAGYQLLGNSFLNKGTAFTEQERDAFELHGLLPPRVATLDEQVSRRLQALRGFATDLERYVFLRELQDTNETRVLRAAHAQHRRAAADRLHADGRARAASISAECSASRAACS